MPLKQNLESDLLQSTRSGNQLKKNVIRMVLSSIKLIEVEKQQALDDPGVINVLQKEIKLRLETIQEARKINRSDLIAQNEAEIEILESYLPAQLSEADLVLIIKKKIIDLDAKDIKDMGRVMKEVIPEVSGKASTAMISQVVRTLLVK